MALSSHRKLNVEQLINLAQVYWDDPGKLMEIVEATEARMDPAAQLLFGAVSNRLNRLRADPLRALGQPPPDLAALIAARLGSQAPPGESDDAPAETAEGEPPPTARDARDRRRWSAVALAGVLLLGAGATWWLWPRHHDDAAAAAAGVVGIEIREGGLVAEEEEDRDGAAPSAPRGRRAPQIIELAERELSDGRATAGEGEPADIAEPRARETPLTEAREARATAVPRALRSFAPEDREPGGGAAGAGGATRTAAAAAAGGRAAPRDAAPPVRISPGVAIEESLLQCYLTDRRPAACAPPGGGASAAAAGRSAPNAEPPPGGAGDSASSRSQNRAAAAASRSGAAAAGSSGSTGPAGGGAGSGSSSGSASGGGSAGGGGAGSGGGSAAGDRPSASASAGGGGGTGKAPPAKPAVTQPASAAPDCPEAPSEGRVVFVFDGSVSMGLPLGLDPAEEDRLDQGVLRRDPEARRQYRALLRQPGPKRMGRAQDAFADAVAELPDQVELGLVVFQECRDIRQVGVFDAAARGSAIDYVDRLIPRGRTPLAQSLASAAELLGDGSASIVLLTDGIEFCQGDPCAVAAELKVARPGTPVHIIDVTGQARTACVAELTGGRSYAPAETDDLAAVLRSAFRGAPPGCPAR